MESNPDSSHVVFRESLRAALMTERELLADLRRALASQRASVSRGEPDAMDAASQVVSRAILTLDEARRRREQLVELAGGDPACWEAFETAGGSLPGVAESRQALRAEAEATVRELAETQELLQAAMRAGDAYLQALFDSVSSAGQPYVAPGDPVVAAPSALLINRRA